MNVDAATTGTMIMKLVWVGGAKIQNEMIPEIKFDVSFYCFYR